MVLGVLSHDGGRALVGVLSAGGSGISSPVAHLLRSDGLSLALLLGDVDFKASLLALTSDTFDSEGRIGESSKEGSADASESSMVGRSRPDMGDLVTLGGEVGSKFAKARSPPAGGCVGGTAG